MWARKAISVGFITTSHIAAYAYCKWSHMRHNRHSLKICELWPNIRQHQASGEYIFFSYYFLLFLLFSSNGKQFKIWYGHRLRLIRFLFGWKMLFRIPINVPIYINDCMDDDDGSHPQTTKTTKRDAMHNNTLWGKQKKKHKFVKIACSYWSYLLFRK